MKQNINLFSPDLLPVKARLTLPRAIALAGGALLVLIATGTWQTLQGRELVAKDIRLKAQEQQLVAELSALSLRVKAHQPNPDLITRLEQTQARIQGLDRLTQVLDRDALLIQPGFSNLMADLAATSDNQVWLQHFQLAEDRLQLTGMARRAAAVPHWIERLGEQPSLQGRPLSQLSIQGEAGKPVRFSAGHGIEEVKL